MELPEIDFEKMNGLVPVVAQDAETGQILMLAYADKKAVELTIETGRAHYYSRSRNRIWEKGSSSGHIQEIVEVRIDCDNDSLLYRVRQKGGACHTGYYSCFYRIMDKNGLRIDGVKVFDPGDIYKS